MFNLVFLIVSFGASLIGAICGMGGGIIIKPLLDSFNILSVSTISFLSGCTVLGMSTYNVLKAKLSKESHFENNMFALAIGAAVGGIIGKVLFSYIQGLSSNPNRVGVVQSIGLGIMVFFTIVYTLNKNKIKTLNITNNTSSCIIGLALGIISSFFGIGGGPFNVIVFYYFFSLDTKTAGEYSIYTIFFSQLANLIFTFIKGNVPEFNITVLLLMVLGGVSGGIFGRKAKKAMSNETVDKLFIISMILIVGISCYNAFLYLK